MLLDLTMKGSLLLIAGLFAMVLMVSLTEGKALEKTKKDKAEENEADVDKNESESQEEEEEEEEDGDRPSHSGSKDGKYRK